MSLPLHDHPDRGPNDQQVYSIEDIEPREQLRSGHGYKIHSAKVKGQLAIVKVFHGRVAKEVRSSLSRSFCNLHPC